MAGAAEAVGVEGVSSVASAGHIGLDHRIAPAGQALGGQWSGTSLAGIVALLAAAADSHVLVGRVAHALACSIQNRAGLTGLAMVGERSDA